MEVTFAVMLARLSYGSGCFVNRLTRVDSLLKNIGLLGKYRNASETVRVAYQS